MPYWGNFYKYLLIDNVCLRCSVSLYMCAWYMYLFVRWNFTQTNNENWPSLFCNSKRKVRMRSKSEFNDVSNWIQLHFEILNSWFAFFSSVCGWFFLFVYTSHFSLSFSTPLFSFLATVQNGFNDHFKTQIAFRFSFLKEPCLSHSSFTSFFPVSFFMHTFPSLYR